MLSAIRPSRRWPRTSVWPAVAACLVLLVVSQSSLALEWLWGEAHGRYGSGNTTMGSDSISGDPLAPDDTTGLYEIATTTIVAGGSGHSALSNSAIAAMSGFLAASDLPNSNTNFFVGGGGGVQYLDAITVTSATLANGTLVEIQFVLQAQHDAFVDHNRIGQGENGNYSHILASITSLATSMWDSVYLSGGDNGMWQDTKDMTSSASGLFTGAQYAAYTLQAEVGETISFSLTVDVDVSGKVSPYLPAGETELANGIGQAYGTVAVAFGASASAAAVSGGTDGPVTSSGDIVLASSILNGPFPPAASATPDAAQAAMPANPYGPIPGDADNDGDVDLDDFVILKTNFGMTTGATAAQGDFDGDGDVDLDDFVILKNNFGA